MTREEFYAQVTAALTNAIANKSLDAWFFNDFDMDQRANDEINATLNAVIPGNWTNVGLGIFYEKDYDMYLDLACYDEENEEYIDEFNLYDKCPFKFDEKTLARISQ